MGMNIHDLERSLTTKYMGELLDEDTAKHITEDVKSVYQGVERVIVHLDGHSIVLDVTFFKPEDQTYFLLRWS
jgi:hypothetical protein